MQFEFATAGRIIFGRHALGEAAPIIADHGSRVLLLTGRDGRRAASLKADLENRGCEVMPFSVCGEPTLFRVQDAVKTAHDTRCHAIIGFGGGSIIDLGKAAAALVTNEGDLVDHLEVIGRGQPLLNPPLPFIAIPTTAGTGTEVTANAVIKSPKHGRKVSLRGKFLLPAVAVVDPALSLSLPPSLTAATGMDALTQLIEAFVTRKANPVTDCLCREGLYRVGRSLRQAWLNGDDLDAREDMSLAALFSGMALANAGLGAVHGFAAVIGGMTEIPHGIVCARLLYPVLRVNLERLRKTDGTSSILQKFHEMGRILTGNSGAHAEEGLEWIRLLCTEFCLLSLGPAGLRDKDFTTIAAMAQQSNSMRGNPVELSQGDLIRILEMEKSMGAAGGRVNSRL